MIFFTTCAFFLALVSASPTLTGLSPTQNGSLHQTIRDCTPQTSNDYTDDKSPWISDCETLASNIRGDGTWRLRLDGEFRQIAQYRSCAFGVQSDICADEIGTIECILESIGHIGNEDIRGVIYNSIAVAKGNSKAPPGKVGGIGVFFCQTDTSGDSYEGSVRWSIYWNQKPW